jgi:hypothetical protein
MIDHLFGIARVVCLSRINRPIRLDGMSHCGAFGATTPARGGTGPLCCVGRLTGVSRRVPH